MRILYVDNIYITWCPQHYTTIKLSDLQEQIIKGGQLALNQVFHCYYVYHMVPKHCTTMKLSDLQEQIIKGGQLALNQVFHCYYVPRNKYCTYTIIIVRSEYTKCITLHIVTVQTQ